MLLGRSIVNFVLAGWAFKSDRVKRLLFKPPEILNSERAAPTLRARVEFTFLAPTACLAEHVLAIMTLHRIINDAQTDTTGEVTVDWWGLEVFLIDDLLRRELGAFVSDPLVTN